MSAEPAITLTDAAARAILDRARRDAAEGSALRVRIQGGGCSGVSYRMTWDEPGEKDLVYERDGARLVVDPRSMVYLKGSTLDFRADLMNQRFVWTNPNAKSSCGCGESFGV